MPGHHAVGLRRIEPPARARGPEFLREIAFLRRRRGRAPDAPPLDPRGLDAVEVVQAEGGGVLVMRVAITGGAGYVGSALVPYLIDLGHEVTVLDLFLYGENVFNGLRQPGRLACVKGDIRNPADLAKAFKGAEAVIHLACISNDPSFELDPHLGKSINYDAFAKILAAVRGCGARRFIYASSSSVYGVQDVPNVREDTPCLPLTDYSKFKLLCEQDLQAADLGGCERVVIRPATVCGYAPRMRLDLTVNILSIHTLVRKLI